MEFDRKYYAGKVAAVTGGASGIGLALCEELLQSGAKKVILADFNRDNLLHHEAKLNEKYPGKVKGIFCDVTIEDNIKSMIEEAAFFGGGRLDLLINCAGAPLGGKFTEEPDGIDPNNNFLKKAATNDDWKKGFDINFYGALYGCRHAIPVMLKQGGGQIVNIISGIAFSPMAYQSMYAATKAALNSLTLVLRAEYNGYHIKFNSATPGTTATAIFKESGGAPPEAQTPHQSAQRILHGVADNDRMILGDDSDLDGAQHCFMPDIVAQKLDELYLNFARQRKAGTLSFTSKNKKTPNELENEMSPDEIAKARALIELSEIDISKLDSLLKKLHEYFIKRGATNLNRDYYKGKTAAVTGGASGIGLALCEELLKSGAEKVVLADYNRTNLAAQEARLNELYPGRVKGIFCDVSNEEDVKTMIQTSSEFFGGKFDILINNAGIGQTGMFSELPDSDEITKRANMRVESPKRWEQIYAVNFFGALYGCRAVLPIMLKQESGQIVNIISGTVFWPMPYQSIYASSKSALNALTLVLRYEYWDYGIMFNSATPGTTATAIFKDMDAPENAQSPEQSAIRILTGAAKNERIIFGDDNDLQVAMFCYNPKAAKIFDEALFNIASLRRKGNLSDYGDKPNLHQDK